MNYIIVSKAVFELMTYTHEKDITITTTYKQVSNNLNIKYYSGIIFNTDYCIHMELHGGDILFILPSSKSIKQLLLNLNGEKFTFVKVTEIFKAGYTPRTCACVLDSTGIKLGNTHYELSKKIVGDYVLGVYYSKLIINLIPEESRCEYSYNHPNYLFYMECSTLDNAEIMDKLNFNGVNSYLLDYNHVVLGEF